MGFTCCCSTCGRDIVLEQLNDTHLGISKMTALARSYVWWPCLEKLLSLKFSSVKYVKPIVLHFQKHHYTRGNAPHNLGQEFILTMWDLSMEVILHSSGCPL